MADPRQDLSNIAGPESMTMPPSTSAASASQNESANPKKKKKHRGGRKRKTQTSSFNALSEVTHTPANTEGLNDPPRAATGAPFYRARNHSHSSLESEALLDHREYTPQRPRRQSLQQTGFTRPSIAGFARHRGSAASGANGAQQRSRMVQGSSSAINEDESESPLNDRTPLLSSSRNRSRPELSRQSSAHYGTGYRARRSSANSKTSSRRRLDISGYAYPSVEDDDYDVNNPPSVPNSPKLGSLDDLMVSDLSTSNQERGRDAIIDIEGDNRRYSESSPDAQRRRGTIADLAERDVCFPAGLSEIGEGEDDDRRSAVGSERLERRRTRQRQWPDLEILDDWSREEKEERTQQEHVRAKKIAEPVMVGGRLRPVKTTTWHREEDDAPFRFTYFNETFDGTIHARTISDLLQEGATFKDLFLPEPTELHDSSDEDEMDDNALEQAPLHSSQQPANGRILAGHQSRLPSEQVEGIEIRSVTGSKPATRSNTPSGQTSARATPKPYQKPKRYGPRPTFWLDVLQPTEMEMKVLAKAFGIHQLTTEDILMEEQREKVELFQSYYFLNYRSFEQDKESEDYMDPVNFYVVVFRDGVITFHHSQTPHPANVRRRIRQLNDYMSPTADWISYAIIDDVTDVYGPRVSQIEEEVDEIDEEILYMHVTSADDADRVGPKTKEQPKKEKSDGGWWPFKSSNKDESGKYEGDKVTGPSGGDMLRRVGECRKKVMSLYRLLGNKADVIKGFAKRCNENWEVAPRSEIGLYLGDIQDHIVTMNNNLSHYENLLSRAHSNYVAQINIRMNERAEQNADILGKLTVVGTIVLPMNIITGMWGMNVYVPGQVYDDSLTWFWCITAGLLMFGFTCFFVARKAYGIV